LKGKRPSSTPIVKGTPFPVAYLMDFFLNMETILSETVSDAMTTEVKRLRKELPAIEPEYKTLAKDFDIMWDQKEMIMSYGVGGDSKYRAGELEYGTPETPAKSIIRKIAIYPALAGQVSDNLDKVLVRRTKQS